MRLGPRLGAALAVLGLAAAATLGAWWLGRGARAAGPLPQEGYLWQRRFDPAAAAGARREGLAGVVALAAEGDLRRWPPRVTEIAFGGEADGGVHTGRGGEPGDRRLGLALRLGASAGAPATAPAISGEVVAMAVRAVARARAAGWTTTELQLDYDCAAARLAS
jgi:hypothetical protein